LSSLQKTTKLLPYAPTNAILKRLKPSADSALLPLRNLQKTIPVFNNIRKSAELINSREISKGATDSLAKPVEAEILASLEESDISRNDRFDKVKIPNGNELFLNSKQDVEIKYSGNNHWLNDLAQKILDALGTVDNNVSDGIISLPRPEIGDSSFTEGSITNQDALEINESVETVAVNRTVNAMNRKFKINMQSDDENNIYSSNVSLNMIDDLSPLEECVLDVIKKTLTDAEVGLVNSSSLGDIAKEAEKEAYSNSTVEILAPYLNQSLQLIDVERINNSPRPSFDRNTANSAQDSGELFWRISGGIAYAPSHRTESYDNHVKWEVVANEGGGIVEVALTSNSACERISISSNLEKLISNVIKVYVQMRLPEMGIISRCETPWPVKGITASDSAVWTIRSSNGHLVVRAGLKYCPTGYDWIEAEPDGPSFLLSVCLYDRSGWALDTDGHLWFTNGVSFENPFGSSFSWLQVIILITLAFYYVGILKVFCPWEGILETSNVRFSCCSIRVSSQGVFLCFGRKIYWISSRTPVSGHRFKHIVPERLATNDYFEMISADVSGNSDDGYILLCRNSELFIYRMRTSNFYSLPTFTLTFQNSVKQLSFLSHSAYVLDSSGCINVKTNICDVTPYGAEWKVLNTGSYGSPIISFAVSTISVWVLTSDSVICMCSNKSLSFKNEEWKSIRLPPGDNIDQMIYAIFSVKIRASSSGSYVWIFSSSTGRAWSRAAISELFPFGKSWTEASNTSVFDLAVGCSVVWSLSSNGQLHRLHGLTHSNPAGNYWKPSFAKLKAISIDHKDRLWAVDYDNRLIFHRMELFSFANLSTQRQDSSASDFFIV
uniref:Ig-like domain-containing protein n=1 Tax=Dracunculus medinensis TaxID=318479 RepID=A0A158Q5W9_DRAME